MFEISHSPFSTTCLLRQKSLLAIRECAGAAVVWRIFPAQLGSACITQCSYFPMDMLTDKKIKMEVKTTTMAHCLVFPALFIGSYWMGLHSWLGTQIAFVASNHEQDSKSVLYFSESDRQTYSMKRPYNTGVFHRQKRQVFILFIFSVMLNRLGWTGGSSKNKTWIIFLHE